MYKVHVAFGFHVNLYHSFRGDTPDDRGFGGDIRVIRRTIEVMDDYNRRGIPVKGTWDFENVYSLERILPEYAPDIIENVRRRSQENGDENILMGYNNGALGAMTQDEFEASIRLAITNPARSGLQDVFGGYAPLVRPQEMIFTPGNAALYTQMGIEGLCLYYSGIQFDGFRTLIPLLDEEAMFNPLRYHHGESSISIIPTLNNGDLLDYGSLSYLVKRLHKRQRQGEIKDDVLVFINMDADSELWYGLKMPPIVRRMPNMGGLAGLLSEIGNMDCVVFDTPWNYLKTHSPKRDVSFGHDLADGNFDGFSSWSEKPFNRLIWTRLDRTRAFSRAGSADAGFDERVRLLSTTHFGLSSPVLNVQRESAALQLSEDMQEKALAALPESKTTVLLTEDAPGLFSATLTFEQGYLSAGSGVSVEADGLLHYGLLPLRYHMDASVAQALLLGRFSTAGKNRTIQISAAEMESPVETTDLEVVPGGAHGIQAIKRNGKVIAREDFLTGFITYDGRKYPVVYGEPNGEPDDEPKTFSRFGITGVELEAPLSLPNEADPGVCRLQIFTLPDEEYLFIHADIQYPHTPEDSAIFNEIAALNRQSDNRWEEAAVLQFHPSFYGDVRLHKRNYCNEWSDYRLASFREAFDANQDIDSFNNHITNGLLGLEGADNSFYMASCRQVLSSMAWCPARLRHIAGQDQVWLNPYGTYFGRQRKHPTHGSGVGQQVAPYSAPQYKSLAPAYNGAREQAVMALYFGPSGLAEAVRRDLCAFSDGAVVIPGTNQAFAAAVYDFVTPTQPRESKATDEKKRNLANSTPLGLQLKVLGVALWSQVKSFFIR